MDFTSKEQTPRTFLRWYSIWLTSNQFNWFPLNFFQSKRYPRNFNQWNRFLRKSYTRAFSQNLPVTEVSLMEFNSIKTVFFCHSSLKLNFRQFPVDGVGFYNFPMEEINFRGFFVHEVHFCGLLLNGKEFLGFSRMKLISVDFHQHLLCFMELLMQICFSMGFWILKTDFPAFFNEFFSMDFVKKNNLTCFFLRWIWFRCVSLSMTPVFLRFLSLK